ncbi:uncharacterized protein EDB91DRAFT_1114810 [Suillus paluster]|uniref:uncharacterized protein n=1 Tax=Suillus paluster TaxID=48578 RepID=UPI001B86CF7A|nr:uncharacterized protein EDB91DRAFT_1114810 [Suillus paluster]KAG1747778.1 hypothetical protein EDB91DRAFT_1114810 [Suillus paluster]
MSPSTVAHRIFLMTTILNAIAVLEYLCFISDEVRLVWPRVRKSTAAKLFLVTRYPGLAGLSFNVWFSYRMQSGVSNDAIVCRLWYAYQTAMIQLLLSAVELILMRQVYKMFQKDRYITGLLFVFGGAQIAAMAVSARLIVIGIRYSPTCVILRSPPSQIYAGVSVIATYTFIFFMMLWRYFQGRSRWSEVLRVWLKITVRDGACTTIAVIVSILFMTLCNTDVIKTQMTGNIVFYVLHPCLWFAVGCIVRNQEKFRESQKSQKGNGNDPHGWTTSLEVELDGITPFDDPDVYPESHSDLKVESTTDVSTSFDSESDVGTMDITDECPCKMAEDDTLPSGCSLTFTRTETGISGEGSGSRN